MMNYLPKGYRVIPVSNEMELNNITVEFNGMPTYFHNQSTNEIYIKQFDIRTGSTNTQKYIKAENAEQEASKFDEINTRLAELEKKLEGGK